MTEYVEEVPVSKIIVDPRIQRGLNSAKAQKINVNFDPKALNVLTLSQRKNGDLVVVDGQHRLVGVQRRTSNEGTVPCHILTGLSLAEEAELFLLLNATTKPRRLDKFQVSVTAGHAEALAITDIARSYGWEIHPNPQDGNVQSVGALEKVYALSEKLEAEPNLVQVVFMVIRGWGHNRYAMNAVLVEGIGKMVAHYGAKVDLDRLQQKLASHPGGPEGLLVEIRQHANVYRIHRSTAAAELVTNAYNKGLSSNALPRWNR